MCMFYFILCNLISSDSLIRQLESLTVYLECHNTAFSSYVPDLKSKIIRFASRKTENYLETKLVLSMYFDSDITFTFVSIEPEVMYSP